MNGGTSRRALMGAHNQSVVCGEARGHEAHILGVSDGMLLDIRL